MRKYFKRGILATILFSMVFAVGTTASMADSKSDLEKKRKQTMSDISKAKEALNHSSKNAAKAIKEYNAGVKELKAANAKLEGIRSDLVKARELDAQMKRKLDAAQVELRAAEADLAAGEARVSASESDVKAFTLESFQIGNQGIRAFSKLLEGESPRQFSERIAINRSVSNLQTAKLDDLQATRVMLELERQEVQKIRDKIAKQKKEAAANVLRIKDLEGDAQAQVLVVDEKVDELEAIRKRAVKAQQEDEAILQEMEDELASLERKIKGLVDSDEGQQENTDGKSTLLRPVGGYVSSNYGWRIHPIYKTRRLHAGTDFAVPCGTPIKAAASGTVYSRGWGGGYGNRIVVNHGRILGKNVVTTYNHMSRYAADKGEFLSRGEVLGYVGTTGASTGCHLHFEVLVNGSTVNPMGWL